MSEWKDISSAPTDGAIHVRGLWVRMVRPGQEDEYEWRQYIGRINQFGDFADDEYGETFGWEPSDYEAWTTLPPPPERS